VTSATYGIPNQLMWILS